jgi:peroxisomal 3,2-trans-enoyl-CoA isomerase
MMEALFEKLAEAESCKSTEAIVLTGSDPYYCAGVDLSSTLKPMHPNTLRKMIFEKNRLVFDTFLDVKKPIVVAINGPAIGASVTTATLCDAIVASEKATFNTPFTKLGVPPEGCSSVHFKTLMGEASAQRMLGKEGFVPTGKEAAEMGLVTKCVPHDKLLETAHEVASELVKNKVPRSAMAKEHNFQMLKDTNEKESRDLSNAFLGETFLQAQIDFLSSKGKSTPANVFKVVLGLRPLWSKLLTKE